MKYYVYIGHGYGLGDKLCMLSASREYVRRTDATVYMDEHIRPYGVVKRLPELYEVVQAYGDNRLRVGKEGKEFPLDLNCPNGPLWQPSACDTCFNYLGMYYAAMRMVVDGPPVLELPRFDAKPSVAGICP